MYNLKKVWISFLLLPIPSSIISIILMFIFNDGFETENFTFSFALFFVISYYSIKEIVLDYFVKINDSDYKKLSHSCKSKKLYQQTAMVFFEKKRSFISSKILFTTYYFILLFIVLVSIISIFYISFSSLPEYSFGNIFNAFFLSIMYSVLFCFFIKYFISKPAKMLFFLFIEPFCYLIKKEINNHKVYLKNNNSLYFYKNGKLHCDFSPAYIEHSRYHSHISVDSVNNDSTNKSLKQFIDDCYNNRTKEEWYLNGEKIKIDKNLPLKEKQKIIKLIQNSKNF